MRLMLPSVVYCHFTALGLLAHPAATTSASTKTQTCLEKGLFIAVIEKRGRGPLELPPTRSGETGLQFDPADLLGSPTLFMALGDTDCRPFHLVLDPILVCRISAGEC